jgi:nitrous oxide reductase accessory protein NosL
VTQVKLPRRALAPFVIAFAMLGCRGGAPRCEYCGMLIDPKSNWRADLVVDDGIRHFDSPRCALLAWRTRGIPATAMRVIDYYDGRWTDAKDVLFVAGSDVRGPMGPDLVPVDVPRAQRFATDHSAGRPLPLAAITAEMLSRP